MFLFRLFVLYLLFTNLIFIFILLTIVTGIVFAFVAAVSLSI